jgi:hypothetical protein
MLNQAQFLVERSGLCRMRFETREQRGVTDDTARTAREITAMLADYYVKKDGQLSGKAQKPKILVTPR